MGAANRVRQAAGGGAGMPSTVGWPDWQQQAGRGNTTGKECEEVLSRRTMVRMRMTWSVIAVKQQPWCRRPWVSMILNNRTINNEFGNYLQTMDNAEHIGTISRTVCIKTTV